SAVRIFDLNGKPVREVTLPGLGSVTGFAGERDKNETFYTFTSYTDPGTIYRYDMKTGQSTVFRQPKVAFDEKQFETRQVFYKSKDGTRIPMILVGKKGWQQNGANPTILYGYGGFNIAQ